ncbi:MAG: hypothetical protein ACREPW_02085, partial [Candidatus Binataceae bacterium]
FEARQDFVDFWRSALDGERRSELLGHLKGCSKCDRAFRAFALTAPMLHSSGATADAAGVSATPDVARPDVPQVAQNGQIDVSTEMNGVRRADAHRTAEILQRASIYRLAERRPTRQWRDAAAGLSAVAAAVLLAYFSVAAPPQSFDDAMVSSDSISEMTAQPNTDFLGQQLPTMPAGNSDFAG